MQYPDCRVKFWVFMDAPYITIDGSYGEGGGQILRSGLQPQHLTCVNACRDISGAYTEGNAIGSASLRFFPHQVTGGNYLFDVAEKSGSAGSTSLVLQTLVPALTLAGHPAKITMRGGTHVPWSPPFHYLKEIFIPLINTMGCSLDFTITNIWTIRQFIDTDIEVSGSEGDEGKVVCRS